MFNGLPVTVTPTYQMWDFSKSSASTSTIQRISLTDDCAPFQYLMSGGGTPQINIYLPFSPPPGKSITFKISNTGTTVSQTFNFYDSSNSNSTILYTAKVQGQVTFTYIPEATYSNNVPSCWIITNTAAFGDYATGNGFFAVSNGMSSAATASYATISGGNSNSASGSGASIGGGGSNVASGSNGTVGGGLNNTASGSYSTIPGGYYGTNRSVYGAFNYASGQFATQGDAQIGDYVYRLSNATGTIVYLTTNGSARSGTNQAVISTNNYAYAFDITVVARDTTNNTDQAAWQILGLISNNAGTVSITGTPTVNLISATSGATTNGWGVTGAITISADTTNKALSIGVTQVTTNTLHWVARVETTEVG